MPAAAQSDLALQEVIVTARKQAESLQDTPVTVTAITAAAIEERGLEDITELAMQVPNLSYQTSFGRHFDRPTIRGMSNILGDPNVGTFIDGIYVSGSVMTQELDNLERVEVVKGPQAALYGRATLAGAINFVTKDPSNEFGAKVSGTVADRGQYEISGSATGPIIEDRLAYFVSGRYYERDNQYANIGTGGPDTGAGGQRSAGATLKLRATPTERFEASLRLSLSNDRDEEAAQRLTQTPDNNCFLNRGGYICGTMPEFNAVDLSFADFPDEFIGIDRQTQRVHLTLDYDFGPVVLTSNTAYNNEDFFRQTDQDYISETVFGGALNQRVNISYEDYSQELRLASRQDRRLRWLLGGYYFHLERDEDRVTFLPSGLRPTETRPPQEVDNYALFGALEFDFTDRFTAIAEVRGGRDELATSGTTRNGAFVRNFDLQETFDSWAPRVILRYELSDDVMTYASAAKGNKPGGFNTGLQRADVVPSELARLGQYISFEEEESWNYELGVKSELLDRRLLVNVAAFFIDWTNQQLTFTEPVQVFNPGGATSRPVGISLIQNAGKTEIYGAELESTWRVNRVLSLNLAYGYTHAEFKEFDDPTQLVLTGSASVAGNVPPRVPRNKWTTGADVRVPIRETWSAFGRVQYSYEGSRYAQVQNLLETGATERLSARVGIETDNWEVALWGKNLTGDQSAVDITRLFDPLIPTNRGFLGTYPDKRQFGVTGTYRF